MFDIGFWELLLIAIVALLVVGPHRLPKLAYEAGIWIGRVQKFIQKTRFDIENELHNYEVKQMLDEQKESIDEFKALAKDAQQDIKRSLSEEIDLADSGNATGKAGSDLESADSHERKN